MLSEQLAVPLAAVQSLPQKPQSVSVLVKLVSQSARLASQSPRPAGHVDAWQRWFAQTWKDVSQLTAQPPQFFGSEAMWVSQPLPGLPSQSR